MFQWARLFFGFGQWAYEPIFQTLSITNMLKLFFYLDVCHISCTRIVINKRRKTRTHTNLHDSAMCLHIWKRRHGNFHYLKLGLHKRIFIITLYMTNLQKYPYSMCHTIPYCVTKAPYTPNLLFRTPTKNDVSHFLHKYDPHTTTMFFYLN